MRRAISLTVYVETDDLYEVRAVSRDVNQLGETFLVMGYEIDTNVYDAPMPEIGYPDAQVVEFEDDAEDKLARLATNPWPGESSS